MFETAPNPEWLSSTHFPANSDEFGQYQYGISIRALLK